MSRKTRRNACKMKNCFLYLHIKNVTFVIRKGEEKNNFSLNSVNSAEENIYSLIINLMPLSLYAITTSQLKTFKDTAHLKWKTNINSLMFVIMLLVVMKNTGGQEQKQCAKKTKHFYIANGALANFHQ